MVIHVKINKLTKLSIKSAYFRTLYEYITYFLVTAWISVLAQFPHSKQNNCAIRPLSNNYNVEVNSSFSRLGRVKFTILFYSLSALGSYLLLCQYLVFIFYISGALGSFQSITGGDCHVYAVKKPKNINRAKPDTTVFHIWR